MSQAAQWDVQGANDTPRHPVVTFIKAGHIYTVNGIRASSVSAIVGTIATEALGPWGQRVAVAGICELARTRRLYRFDDEDRIFEALKAHGLTTGGVAAKARALGTTVHEVLALIAHGETVRAEDYPDPESGHVRALLNGIEQLAPTRFLGSEVVVGSAVHGFAGTYDALIETGDGKRIRLDLKTSKAIFESHHLQLRAYEEAAVECGEEAADRLVILRTAADGSFELVDCVATIEQFLAVKAAYDAITKVREALGDR